jgi:hypothetical protein
MPYTSSVNAPCEGVITNNERLRIVAVNPTTPRRGKGAT